MGVKKLNMGCGRNIKEDYINLDITNFPGVDFKHDLTKFPYPFKDNYFDEILLLGVLELINTDFIKIMEELHRICKPKAIIKIRSPVFPNMCSAQDPLTKKFMTWNTFEYFKDDGLNYYSKARFKTLKRIYIYSLNSKINLLGFWINWFPQFYTRFLFNLFPSNNIYYELEVIK